MRLLQLKITLSTLLFFAFCYSLSAQKTYAPFSTIKSSNKIAADAFVARSMDYNLSLESIAAPLSRSREMLILDIPTLGGSKIVELERVQVLAGNYTLKTEDGVHNSNAKRYKFYRGKVKGIKGSSVGLSIMNGELHMLIHDQDGSFEIKKSKEGKSKYFGFFADEIKKKKFIPCETDTQNTTASEDVKNEDKQRAGTLDCVEIYLEIDFKAYEKNGSSVVNTETWALAILSQVALFYADAGIPITVSEIKIYTTIESDPYTGANDTAEALSAFRTNLNNLGFNGRLAHLLSGRNLGGGRAWLNVLCSNYSNYAVSGNLNSGGTTYSSYTWNINVIAHELGHNFGSSHTHDCVWNGDNTQIDDCGNVWLENNGYNTGSCYDSENKNLPGNTGTIMSYCHAVGGASINLNLGFHPQVRDVIYNRYMSTNCGGSEACIGVPPSNDLCSNGTRLTPTIACNSGTFDNIYATDSGTSPGFSCGGSTGLKDTWFIVKLPSNGLLTIETNQVSGGLSDMVIQVYSGECGTLVSQSCDDNDGSGNHSKIDLNEISLADEDLLIRVVEKNDVEGEFGICAYSADLPCVDNVVEDLISFYEATGGENWTNNTGWAAGLSGTDCNYCNWYGVTCNANDQVTAIQLSNNNLAGSLDNSLLNLDMIESANLSSNNLQGNLAELFVNPLNLKYLYLDNNNFVGAIPQFLVDAPKLESLTARQNNLSGDLPAFTYSSKVTFLDLSDNDFSGCFPSSYTKFFSSGEINILGNTNLPFNGDFYGYATDYSGFDFDKDGFCFNVNDCVDFNNTIYDGAPELCDGLDNDCDDEVDEGLDNGPNTWIGPTTAGKWNVDANWSMGHTPRACEDVEVGMSGGTFAIDSSGSQSYYEQSLKSICVGPNTTLDLPSNFTFYVKNGYVLNMGVWNINGYTSFSNLDPTKNGIENSGVITINSGTYVSLSKSGVNGFHNRAGGILNNNGTLSIDSNHPVNGNVGLLNEHIINNSGFIDIRGDFKVRELHLKTGSELNNPGRIDVGGESFGEGN